MDTETSNQVIIQKLRDYQQQHLTYYQATQELKKLGYSDQQIQQASDSFDYTATPTTDGDTPAALPTLDKQDPAMLKIAESNVTRDLLADKHLDGEPPESEKWHPVGLIGHGFVMAPESLNTWWPILGLIVAGIAVLIYVFKFHGH
jgi:hypothetical protein